MFIAIVTDRIELTVLRGRPQNLDVLLCALQDAVNLSRFKLVNGSSDTVGQ